MIELRLVGKRRHDEQAISTYMLGEEGRVTVCWRSLWETEATRLSKVKPEFFGSAETS
jgi:hypothetical protein